MRLAVCHCLRGAPWSASSQAVITSATGPTTDLTRALVQRYCRGAGYEPRLALDGGADGLDLIRELVRQAAALLRPRAWLLLECGDGQATALGQMLRLAWPGASSRVVADYAGLDRVVIARVPC
jgi:hypothetical protein